LSRTAGDRTRLDENADALKKFRLACALKPLLLRRVSPYSHLGEPLFEGAT
jgi:hypothetical protein